MGKGSGWFGKKRRDKVPHAQAVIERAEGEQVDLRLTKKNYKLASDGWKSEGGTSGEEDAHQDTSAATHEARRELAASQARVRELESAVTALQEQLAAAQGEGRSLREKWNLTDFKYQLLVDMWTMRVLDNDVTAAGAEEEGALPSEQALTTGA